MSKIAFQNYKAFRDAELTIKPINILMGTNGSGKSSILQLLMLLNQSQNRLPNEKISSIRLNGHVCSMGAIDNLFFGKNTTEPIEISFILDNLAIADVSSTIIKEACDGLKTATEQSLYFLGYISNSVPDKAITAEINKTIDLTIKEESKSIYTTEGFKVLAKEYTTVRALVQRSEKLVPKEEKDRFFFRRGGPLLPRQVKRPRTYISRAILPRSSDISSTDLGHALNFISFINDLRGPCVLTYVLSKETTEVGKQEIRLEVSALRLDTGDSTPKKQILGFSKKDHSEEFDYLVETDLDIRSILDYREIGKNTFDGSKFILNNIRRSDVDRGRSQFFHTSRESPPSFQTMTGSLVARWLGVLEQKVSSHYQDCEMVAVKPLRGFPRRYYDAYGAEHRDETFDILEALKHDGSVKSFINSWVRRFGIEIDAEEYEDFLGKIYTRRDFCGQKVDIDLIDSGFGFSQVLPILYLGAVADADAFFLVEQPEIHLHPRMQAELADFFIDLYNFKRKEQGGNFRMVIETHSEYLVKRLSRRIGEKTFQSFDHESTAPSANDVSMWFTEKASDGYSTSVRSVDLGEYGEIAWPSEFFETRNEDLKGLIDNKIRALSSEE